LVQRRIPDRGPGHHALGMAINNRDITPTGNAGTVIDSDQA
jgi:hypothetical protein